jgi:hypothetical protein
MPGIQQRFELVAQPKNADEAMRLSMFVTQQFGSKGWEIVSVVPAGLALILVFQKPF